VQHLGRWDTYVIAGDINEEFFSPDKSTQDFNPVRKTLQASNPDQSLWKQLGQEFKDKHTTGKTRSAIQSQISKMMRQERGVKDVILSQAA